MSTLKVDAIRHNSATSDAITTACRWNLYCKINFGKETSHRNIIINGAMKWLNVVRRHLILMVMEVLIDESTIW